MATISDFGIPDLGGLSGLLQPKLKDRWRVIFQNIGTGANTANLSYQALNVKLPTLSFEEIELHRYNTRGWIIGKHNWEACTVSVEDDVKGTAGRVIKDQLQKQQWLIGAEGPWLGKAPEASLYKFATNLQLLDGKEQVIEQWKMEGCFIQQANFGDVDYTANEAIKIELTIRFDHAFKLDNTYSGPGLATGGKAA